MYSCACVQGWLRLWVYYVLTDSTRQDIYSLNPVSIPFNKLGHAKSLMLNHAELYLFVTNTFRHTPSMGKNFISEQATILAHWVQSDPFKENENTKARLWHNWLRNCKQQVQTDNRQQANTYTTRDNEGSRTIQAVPWFSCEANNSQNKNRMKNLKLISIL